MVICKFFLQGTCKFGNNCRFEHQLGMMKHLYGSKNYRTVFSENYNNSYQNHPGSGSSILRQTHFTNHNPNTANIFANPPQTAPSTVDTNSLLKVVLNDIALSENGGQWRLSCYGPFSEKPSYPNFQDYSFEEIRLWFYEAKKNNQLGQFQSEWIRLQNEANMQLMTLKNPTADIVNTILSLYNSKGEFQSPTATATPFTFTLQPSQQQFFQNPTAPSSLPTTSPFQQQPIANSPFQQQTGSIFAPQTSIFNTPPANPSLNSNQNIFQNTFQQPQTQQPIFSQPPQPAPPHPSIFNQQQGANTDLTPNLYSKIEDLTEEEINWFQSSDLTLEKIPERPPTFELCFQT